MKKLLLLITFLVLTLNSFAQEIIKGKIVGVVDGDTVTVLSSDKRQFTVRLAGIDAPEKRQDFGNAAKEHLSDLIFDKAVIVEASKLDKYGRLVGKILINKQDVNLEMVKAGFAWHYKEYENEQSKTDREAYTKAELDAREDKKGLWIQPNAVKPSEFRRDENNGNAAVSPASTPQPRRPRTIIEAKDPNDVSDGSSDKNYVRGKRGGCYYINSNGNKTYVDRSMCN